jgi:hypothetical protein
VALGGCDLSVLYVGGEWQWLVRQAGRNVAEGAARAAVEAKQQAAAVALRFSVQAVSTMWSVIGASSAPRNRRTTTSR